MEDIEKITKENQERRKYEENKTLQNGITMYTNSLNKSVIRSKVRKNSSRKKIRKNFNRKLIGTTLAIITLISIATIGKGNINLINPIAAITSTIETSKKIDEIIKNFQNIMEKNQKYEIESSNSMDENYNKLVYYDENNINNLVTVITEAAKNSEQEARCAILAAYKIINAPYREEVLNEAFKKANSIQQETNFSIPSSLEEYLEKLGYSDLEDYNNNERKNIKDLEKAEIKTEGKTI